MGGGGVGYRESSLEGINRFKMKEVLKGTESSAHGKKLSVVISRGLRKRMNRKTFCEEDKLGCHFEESD